MSKILPIDVSIGGKSYRFAAPTEQVERLQALALRVDAILNEVKANEPNTDRDRHAILCCLTLMSDLADAQTKLDEQATSVTQFHRMLADRLTQLIPAE